MAGHDSLDSSWVDVDEEINKTKGHCHPGGSGVEGQPNQNSNTATTLEFHLTQSLLNKVEANKDNVDANSGEQAYKDLRRMNFVINGQNIDKTFINQLYEEHSSLIENNKKRNYRSFAGEVFKKMFEYARAEVLSDSLIEKLITHCNQAGYEHMLYDQIQRILGPHNLIPTISQKTISIHCTNPDSVNVEYSESIVVKNSDPDQSEQYGSSSKLEFTLKFQNDEVKYEDGKVTFIIPEQLKSYKANGKSLLDDINEHFDVGNGIIESLTANIDEGPKSFVAEDSSIIIEGNDTSTQALDNIELSENTGEEVGAIGGFMYLAKFAVDAAKEMLFPQDQNNIKPSRGDEPFALIAESLTFDEIVNALKKAIDTSDYNELDRILSNVQEKSNTSNQVDYGELERSIDHVQESKEAMPVADLSRDKLRDFCLQQLHLIEQSDYCESIRGMIIQRIFNKESGSDHYSVKELVSLAIVANDMLVRRYAEEYKDMLFKQDEDSDRLLVGVGGQEYIKALLEYLEKNRDKISPWDDTCKKLERAIFVGNQESITAIIEKFKDTEAEIHHLLISQIPSKLLHYAIQQDFKKAAKMIVEHKGVDVSSTDSSGYTPLHYAVMRNDLELVGLLIKNGAKVDIKDSRYGRTALHLAALRGCLEKVKLLVEKGADWNIVDSDGNTALDLASQKNKSEVVGFLKDLDSKTPLYYAVLKNRPDVVEKLVLEGADINGIVRYGTKRLKVGYPCVKHTPVTRAIFDHQLELVRLLLRSKADVNTEVLGRYGTYYLSLAIEESGPCKSGVKWEIFNLILEHVPHISTLELKKAVSTGNLDLIKLLTNKGAVITKEIIEYASGQTNGLEYAEVVRFLQSIGNNRHYSNLANEKPVTRNVSNKESLLNTENIEDDPMLKSDSKLQNTQPKTLATGSEHVEGDATVHQLDSKSAPVPSVANENSDLGAVNNCTTAGYHELTNGSDSSSDEFFGAEDDECSETSSIGSNCTVIENNVSSNEDRTDDDEFVSAIDDNQGAEDSESESISSQQDRESDTLNSIEAPTRKPNVSSLNASNELVTESTLKVLPTVDNGNPNNIAVADENVKMPILEEKSDTEANGKQSTNPNNGGVTTASVQSDEPEIVDKNSGKKDTQPKPTVVSVASKDSERVNNAQGNSKQPSYPDKNNPAPQNASSKLPVVAASMLAITGVALGVAIAVYLEMLAVGIAVGACCLVAAAIIYYCNQPSKSLENSNAQRVTSEELETSCCT